MPVARNRDPCRVGLSEPQSALPTAPVGMGSSARYASLLEMHLGDDATQNCEEA